MKVDTYDTKGNFVNTYEYVKKINSLNDGRLLVHYTVKCQHCNQDSEMVLQVPSGYTAEIKNDL